MDELKNKALDKHYEWKGKIKTAINFSIDNKEELAIGYTPGVAYPCLEIQKDYSKSFELTRRWNTVAVITDGTAVLGLGDIGPEAGMPVMEGKCALFKRFGNVDAIPICIRSKDVDELVRTIYLISGSFGGINLEDISAPRCFIIEEKLKHICDIPIFHDDQHGTAIVIGAATLNALKLANKNINDAKIVINGAGAAGIAVGRFLLELGASNIIWFDKNGAIFRGKEGLNGIKNEIQHISNPNNEKGTLLDAVKDADVLIGLSAANVFNKQIIQAMTDKPIVFPCANPIPEISYEDAKNAGAFIVGTGSSLYPNQINNLLAFPGVFRGTLDARAKDITLKMKKAACYALIELTKDYLDCEHILPSALDDKVHQKVAKAVYDAALER
ncbi:MAG: NADP-dependent malic enzyme [Bacillales bacterium]|nr:NADP-dependent malic enzyme [Erysipelotrichaceae bacterium]MDD7316430.1 NADP-dependent malic enzyme [Bacillales bacterium]MDY6003813.1 NADP-dependent malic enzyme [Bacilli bacterium]